MASRASVVVGLVLAIVAAGCVQLPSAGTTCTGVEVPPLRGGARYTYAAEGRYQRLHDTQPSAMWEYWYPNTSRETGPITFRSGDELTIAAGSGTEQRMGILGNQHEARQVTHWVEPVEESEPAPVIDVWLDADEGTIVHDYDRVAQTLGGPMHFMHFALRQQPALLGMPLLWNRTVEVGDSQTYTYQQIPATADSPKEQRRFEYEVVEVRPADGTSGACAARLEVSLTTADATWDVWEGTLVVRDDRALPVRYAVAGRNTRDEPFDLSLQRVERGSGETFAGVDELPDGIAPDGPGLASGPPDDGFLPRGEPVFETPYDDAVRRIRDEEEAKRWFEDHPRAGLDYVEHTVGAPNESTREQWSICWADRASDDQLCGVVARQDPTVPMVESEYSVSTSTYTRNVTPPRTDDVSWASLPAIAGAFERLYGEELEILSCKLDPEWKECGLGTRESMGSPSAGNVGTVGGLRVWFEKGWIAQSQAHGDAPLAEPVPFT